jgi:uncharacterized protein DUF1579
MTPKIVGTVLCAAVLAVTSASAQAPPEMTPEQKAEMEAWTKAGMPGPEHQALAATAGNYDVKMKNWMEPGAPPSEEAGTVERKMELDGRVLVEHFKGAMMGQPFMGHGMTGYNNVTGKYWSTWNDSMSTALFVSEGTCDTKHACTFKGTMINPVTKKQQNTRMTTRWTSPTVEVFEMYGPDKKGKEYKMMELTYTKKS